MLPRLGGDFRWSLATKTKRWHSIILIGDKWTPYSWLAYDPYKNGGVIRFPLINQPSRGWKILLRLLSTTSGCNISTPCFFLIGPRNHVAFKRMGWCDEATMDDIPWKTHGSTWNATNPSVSLFGSYIYIYRYINMWYMKICDTVYMYKFKES